MNDALAREILETGLNRYERRLNAGLLDGFQSDFHAWPEEAGPREAPERTLLAERWVAFLRHRVEERLAGVFALRKRHAIFVGHHAHAATTDERRQLVLEYARDLGAGAKRLEGDRRAFARWFGPDAVTDRYTHHHTAAERRIACAVNRLGAIAAVLLREAPDPAAQSALWSRLGLEPTLRPLLAYDGDSRVCVEAFQALVADLEVLPPDLQERTVTQTTLQFIYRSAIDSRQQVWIQCAAIHLLRGLSAESFRKVIEIRLAKPGTGDDLFVRRRAVRLLGETVGRRPELAGLLPAVLNDPNPFVRQAAPRALADAPAATVRSLLEALVLRDASPQVRAAAVLEVRTLLKRADTAGDALALLARVLRQDADEFVLRTAVQTAADVTRDLAGGPHPLLAGWLPTVREELGRLHVRASSLSVRRWAAQARERIWCDTTPAADALRRALEEPLRAIPPGRSHLLPRGVLRGHDEARIGRVVSVLAQADFGIDLERRWWGDVVTRGHVMRFRLWRVLHELRNPSPDKREGFPHTIGRVFFGGVRAPSAILCELAETKVPGEPLFMPSEGGWRPYLPLVDEALSCVPLAAPTRPLRVYTSEGVTEVVASRWWIFRLIARVRLSWRFAALARLRNWREGEQIHPASWVRELRRMGFSVRFRGHDDGQGGILPADPAVERFFEEATAPTAAAP